MFDPLLGFMANRPMFKLFRTPRIFISFALNSFYEICFYLFFLSTSRVYVFIIMRISDDHQYNVIRINEKKKEKY